MSNPPARITLAHLPTPVQHLPRLSARVGREIYVWRDDLTGFTESGNKIRKLEFLLADAVEQKATRIITAGGAQSNHTRATAFACRRLGLPVSIIVREPKDGSHAELSGNLLLNAMCGAELRYLSYQDYQEAGGIYRPFLEQFAREATARGEVHYVIPEGGSVPLGSWGYINAVEELATTWKQAVGTSEPDALFCAVGSGGTHAGLHLGFERQGWNPNKLWAVNVCDTEDYFQMRVGALIEQTSSRYGLEHRPRRLQILDGHFGAGYGSMTDEDLRFYIELVREEGLLLDPVYTGKAFQGMLKELAQTPERFGEKILFLHSGGNFALFAQEARLRPLLG